MTCGHTPVCSVGYVEAAKAERYCPAVGKGFFKSDVAFFHSGNSGQWEGHLTGDELAAYGVI